METATNCDMSYLCGLAQHADQPLSCLLSLFARITGDVGQGHQNGCCQKAFLHFNFKMGEKNWLKKQQPCPTPYPLELSPLFFHKEPDSNGQLFLMNSTEAIKMMVWLYSLATGATHTTLLQLHHNCSCVMVQTIQNK